MWWKWISFFLIPVIILGPLQIYQGTLWCGGSIIGLQLWAISFLSFSLLQYELKLLDVVLKTGFCKFSKDTMRNMLMISFNFSPFCVLLSDAVKTWWPAPTSLQSSLRVFCRLPTRRRCLKGDSSSEFSSCAPSLKILTYSVTNQSFCHDVIIVIRGVCAAWISATFRCSLYLLGVIPKAVMDSTEFLTNFHFLKDAKRGHKKRHSFKGKKYETLEKCSTKKIELCH